MKVLCACEESQAVCAEFRKLGFEAYSCDILPTSGKNPEWHLQQDVIPLLKEHWDLIIGFPPCTYLTITGNRWFNVERYGAKAIERYQHRLEAINLFMAIASADCEHIAIENPIGIMSTEWRKPDQIIEPYYFGDPYEKKTCLWLKGLPKLEKTNVVEVPERVKLPNGKTMARWYWEIGNMPIKMRGYLRSKTFPGIAKAMAQQWGEYLKEKEK